MDISCARRLIMQFINLKVNVRLDHLDKMYLCPLIIFFWEAVVSKTLNTFMEYRYLQATTLKSWGIAHSQNINFQV